MNKGIKGTRTAATPSMSRKITPSGAPTMSQLRRMGVQSDKASVKNTGKVIKEMPMMKVNTGKKSSTPTMKKK